MRRDDIKILVTAELHIDTLRKTFPDITFDIDGYVKNHRVMTSYELSEKIASYDVLISEFETIDSKVIENAKKLSLIICNRGGARSVIDMEAAKNNNITVMYNAGRNANAVSEIVMGYILDFCRNIRAGDFAVKSGKLEKNIDDVPKEYKDSIWGFGDESPYRSLRGRSPSLMTLGIVGYGHVGRAVADKARAFGMKIVICDPMEDAIATAENIKKLDLDTLLRVSDIVTLHCPLTNQNKKMMTKAQFSIMKESSFFINTARGALVNEEALIEALDTEKIAGAAIDVSVFEPIPVDSRLLTAKNLIITPHIAGSSDEVVNKGTEMTIHKLLNWLEMDLVM